MGDRVGPSGGRSDGDRTESLENPHWGQRSTRYQNVPTAALLDAGIRERDRVVIVGAVWRRADDAAGRNIGQERASFQGFHPQDSARLRPALAACG